MTMLLTFSRRLFPRLTRRGSILIMVVAVLVLLALMGTAYISTARLDRASAPAVNESNPGDVVDSLIPSINQMAEDVILKDVLTQTGGFRSPSDTNYGNWDYPPINVTTPPPAATATWASTVWATGANDYWLGARLPDMLVVTNIAGATNVPAWWSISRPLNQPAAAAGAHPMFESPYSTGADLSGQPVVALQPYPNYSQDIPQGANPPRICFIPTDLAINYPANFSDSAMQGKTRVFPAFYMYDPGNRVVATDPSSGGQPLKVLAADADGDGIADSGLWKLSTIDGVTYYAAVRIIDNNSAVNVNTAWSRDSDFNFGGGVAPPSATMAMFPANIGLLQLLNSTNPSGEMGQINLYRDNATNAANQPVDDPKPDGNPGPGTNSPRGDFTFTTQFEALYAQKDSRLDYPGWRTGNGNASPVVATDSTRYRAFTLAANADLAYRFDMMNANLIKPAKDSVDFEMNAWATTNGHDSVYQGAPNYTDPGTALPPNQVALDARFRFFPATESEYWFEYSFDFVNGRRNGYPNFQQASVPVRPLRSVLTPSNPISNLSLMHTSLGGSVPHDGMLPYGSKGRWNADYAQAVGYKRGDIVIHHFFPTGVAPGITRVYVALQNNTSANLPNTDTVNWAPVVARGEMAATPAFGAGYVAGNVVVHNVPKLNSIYVCLTNTAAGVAPNTAPGAGWTLLPGGSMSPHCSLNTAPFAELFRAFWNVMAPDTGVGYTPFDAGINNEFGTYGGAMLVDPRGGPAAFPYTFNDPYIGMKFQAYDFVGGAPATPRPFAPITNNTPGIEPGIHPLAMFRSSIRAVGNTAAPQWDGMTPRLPPDQQLLLRAAIAAVNAEDIRDNDSDITAREVQLKAIVNGVMTPVHAVVYGTEPQPFITEVYAQTDTGPETPGQNLNGYVCVELYNPYPVPISMENWALATVNRHAGSGPNRGGAANLVQIADFGSVGQATPPATPSDVIQTYPAAGSAFPAAPISIPPYGYLIMENYIDPAAGAATPGSATYRPGSSGLPPNGPLNPPTPTGSGGVVVAYVPGLSDNGGTGGAARTVTDLEMLLVRPRKANGTLSASPGIATDEPYFSGVPYDERETNADRLQDMVPVDSYDFTGLTLPPSAPLGGIAAVWHYVRANSNATNQQFRFVYPGRYNAANTVAVPVRSRQAGTQEAQWNNGTADASDPWDPNGGGLPPSGTKGPAMSLGQAYDAATNSYTPAPVGGDANGNATASYPQTFPVQIANGNFAIAAGRNVACVGFNPITGAAAPMFPFGGFARTGDVLHVPFIGAYRLLANVGGAATLLEMNPITMDAAMAEDTDIGDDPLPGDTGALTELPREQLGRFCPSPVSGAVAAAMPSYEWASDVLDQFTAIQNTHDDFLPNVDPARYSVATPPRPVPNLPNAFPNTPQDMTAPIQGTINVNTASTRVLSLLPLVTDTATGQVDVASTENLAAAIVYFRDVNDGSGKPHGPFKSLFELNAVTDQRLPADGGTGAANGFANMLGKLSPTPDDNQGDNTPYNATLIAAPPQPPADGVQFDYEKRNLNLMRLSNLLTTRSDTFTVYVLVQGWRLSYLPNGRPGPYPELVAEKRSSFIVDRSQMTSTNTSMKTVTVPVK